MFILKLLFFVLFFIVGLVLLLMLPGKIYRHFFPLSEDQKATIEARKRLGEHLAAKKAAEKIKRDDAVLARINALAETYTFNGSLNVAMVCPHCSNKGKVRNENCGAQERDQRSEGNWGTLTERRLNARYGTVCQKQSYPPSAMFARLEWFI
jgi:multidrug efflux pump subunit AcrB